MDVTTGECFCADIGYEIHGELLPARSCHCSRCRKAFSGAGSAMLPLAPNSFRWRQGEDRLTTYINQHGIGLGFCRQCGSTLCVIADGAVVGVTLGTLNCDPSVAIGQHIFVGSKAGWDDIGGPAPQHDAWPD